MPQPRRTFLQTCAAVPLAGAAHAWFSSPATAAVPAALLAPGNEKIKRDRDAALAVLKPTNAQVEHGFELHANSLVFDAYGFAPRSAPDAAAFQSAIDANASDAELADLSEELRMTGCVTSETERAEFLDAFRAAGVTCIFQNAGEEGNDPLRLIKRLARYSFVTDQLRDAVFKAVTSKDLLAAKQQDKLCLCLTGNGVPLMQQWQTTRDELGLIRIFFQLGIRMMHTTYNRRNPIGDGAGEPGNAGLSEFGKEVIAEMNRVGVIVDVAHSGWQTSLEAAQASTKPMVASHTTCVSLQRHIRAKPDNVIQAICDTGGLVGICCISSFLGGAGDISALLDHIDYVVKKFGIDHVAIGTDVAYESRNAAAAMAKIVRKPGRPANPRFESLWPPGSLTPGKPEAVRSLAWTNWPLFTVGLVQRGYSDQDIQKILGGNMLRVLAANAG